MAGRFPKKEKNTEVTNKACLTCKKELAIERNFYASTNSFDADGRVSICKKCLKDKVDYNDIETVKSVLLQLNKPFIYTYWLSSVQEATHRNPESPDILGSYMKTLFLNTKDLTWKDSDSTDPNATLSVTNEENNEQINLSVLPPSFDQQNKNDVIRMVGYDPFELENESDKRHLYNKLVDFLDESTLEDSFKLPAVIEIVKAFNQIDKINSALSLITSNAKSVAENVGNIQSLITAKEKMLKSVLALAKDNGISVNHNNNRSKGAGTLSGIIKQLQEKGIESAEVNLYDIETSLGMKQVADISNKSIFEQLMLNENDYSEMIKEQREMIENLTEKTKKLEEENRLLKVKIKFMEIEDKKRIQVIDGDEFKDE